MTERENRARDGGGGEAHQEALRRDMMVALFSHMRDGERICNLEKAINSRLGYRRAHDTICERWMWEPTDEGMYPGSVAANMFNDVLDEYYEWRGWDIKSGLQKREKLAELGLDDVAEVLEQDNALA